jgi:hypothetical protein
MKRVLFICKDRDISYFGGLGDVKSSGLWNSSEAICKMINKHDMAKAKIVKVIDNNDIDREVFATHVIIEALWVVPEKFEVLQRLHPKVQWYVRLHSDIPFLANEGMAIEWLFKYLNYDNVRISFNSKSTLDEFKDVSYSDKKLIYLPNYYKVKEFDHKRRFINKRNINIGCFGAIRPFKNNLMQAMSAIKFADNIGKDLYFHINSTRVELKGDSILRNIRALFANSYHNLVEIPWLDHPEFITFIDKNIDISMQVSFSETFNIVVADSVNCGIPVVVSPEIYWIDRKFKADPNSGADIVKKLYNAYDAVKDKSHEINTELLHKDNEDAIDVWEQFLRKDHKRNRWIESWLGRR